MRIIPAKFQPSVFKTVGGDRGYTDRQTSNSRGEWAAREGLAFFLAQKMPIYLIYIVFFDLFFFYPKD